VAGVIASHMGISAGRAAKNIKCKIAFALINCHAEAVLTRVDPQWNVLGYARHASQSQLLM
jgi:hypothetical protein